MRSGYYIVFKLLQFDLSDGNSYNMYTLFELQK